jgi:hypothetical protein
MGIYGHGEKTDGKPSSTDYNKCMSDLVSCDKQFISVSAEKKTALLSLTSMRIGGGRAGSS